MLAPLPATHRSSRRLREMSKNLRFSSEKVAGFLMVLLQKP